jgi:hypothetical protein
MSLTVSLIAFSGATPYEGAFRRHEREDYRNTYDKLWTKATIESKETLIPKDFPCTVHAILIQKLADDRASLILHSRTKVEFSTS